ncbi:DUF2071 domain-containing protein [Brevibacillus sp. WF146]|uniref:YqjF family protein n=1 Tax=Brevibacillus sp. WF146 TaxID=319501 RepID=UPI000800BA00|nr:DUF2071 domain-containing protein [Brevibacillus sp. WF146]UYZ11737.1 DUF2071 domain-containing protein [Brevibacillus sp. WF146]
MTQTWDDLLFAHWPVPAERIRQFVPPPLEVDIFDGMAWIGVIPFEMSEIRLRFLPVIPYTVPFPEINVRTYVIAGGKPAVFFLTLDASNPVAIRAATWTYHLPYYPAGMTIKRTAAGIDFHSERKGGVQRFDAIYRPTSEPFTARPGSIEHWLTERYRFCCVCRRTQRIYGGDIYHEPWRLQVAQAVIRENTMADLYGAEMSKAPVHLHYAQGVKAWIWRCRRMFG